MKKSENMRSMTFMAVRLRVKIWSFLFRGGGCKSVHTLRGSQEKYSLQQGEGGQNFQFFCIHTLWTTPCHVVLNLFKSSCPCPHISPRQLHIYVSTHLCIQIMHGRMDDSSKTIGPLLTMGYPAGSRLRSPWIPLWPQRGNSSHPCESSMSINISMYN